MDTLYYDGQCPLCSKEIATLRRLETGNLAFADIHTQDNSKELLPDRKRSCAGCICLPAMVTG